MTEREKVFNINIDEEINNRSIKKKIIQAICFPISAGLSMLLFWNFGMDIGTKIIFAAIAIAFELWKIDSFQEFKELFIISKKTCNECGYVNTSLNLMERRWVCPECGAEYNRFEKLKKNKKIFRKPKPWISSLIIFIILLCFSLYASYVFINASVKSQSYSATEDNSVKLYYNDKINDIKELIKVSKDSMNKLNSIATNKALRNELNTAKADYKKYTDELDKVKKELISYSSTNKGEKLVVKDAFSEASATLGINDNNIFLGIFLGIIAIMIEVGIIYTAGPVSRYKKKLINMIKEWVGKRKMKKDLFEKPDGEFEHDTQIIDKNLRIEEIPSLHSNMITDAEINIIIEKEDLIRYIEILFEMKKSPTAKRLASQEVIARETGWDRKKINEVQDRLQNIFIDGIPVIQIEAKSGTFSNFLKEQVRDAVINS
jgi:hypothetical protein